MRTGESVSKAKIIKLYWPRAYYDLEDLGYIQSLGQKRKGYPSSYIILKTLPTPRRLKNEHAAIRA